MTDQQVCPIDGTRRLGAFRYCRTCNFDFETGAAMPPAPPIPSVLAPEVPPPAQAASTIAKPAQTTSRPAAATPPPSAAARVARRPATDTAEAAPPPVAPPAAPRELSAAERWQALTAQVDASQGWTPPAPTERWPEPAQPSVQTEHDPELGWDAVDESERVVGDPGARPYPPDDRPHAGTRGAPPPALAAGAATARAAATTGAVRAAETARVVSTTVAREVRRYDRTIATRWPKRRWLIHGGTGVVALALLAIPLSAAPAPATGSGPTAPAATTAPTVAIGNQLRIDEPANGSSHATDRVTFRGIGPAGAFVVQDIPLADDPRTTIGADGVWSLDVTLGPGENLITLRLGDDRATQVVWTLTSTLAAVTPTPAPTAVPRAIVPAAGAPAAFATISLKGTGTSTVEFDIPEDAVAIAGIVHKGKGMFRVTSVDANGQPTQVLVDGTGTYRGTSLFDVDVHSSAFQIEADGAWTVTIKPVGGSKVWDGRAPLEGTGSAVTRLATPAGASTAATVTHDGGGPFVLVGFRLDGREVLIETVGTYSSAIVIPEGTVLFEIVTRGDWRIAMG